MRDFVIDDGSLNDSTLLITGPAKGVAFEKLDPGFFPTIVVFEIFLIGSRIPAFQFHPV